MTIFWSILLILAAAIGAILVISAMKPNQFRVTRSLQINAPAATIYANLVDLERWSLWSPWQQKDPAMSQSFGTIRQGVGATMAWDGNNQVGSGRMEVVEAESPTRTVFKLNFYKPFKAENQAEFTIQEASAGTTVHWTMTGPAPLMSKVMDTLMNMDRMIGRDFEQGLANLKRISEA